MNPSGNWQEELALESATGFSRAPNPKQKEYFNNHDRVIAHTDRVESSAFVSTAHAGMAESKDQIMPRKVGLRKKLKEEKFLAQAKAEAAAKMEAEEKIQNTVDYTSVNQSYGITDTGISRLR